MSARFRLPDAQPQLLAVLRANGDRPVTLTPEYHGAAVWVAVDWNPVEVFT